MNLSDTDDISSARYPADAAIHAKFTRFTGALADAKLESAFLASWWRERRKVGLAVSSVILFIILIFGIGIMFPPPGMPTSIVAQLLTVAGFISIGIALWCLFANRPGYLLDVAMFLPAVTLSAFLVNDHTGGIPGEVIPGIVMISMFVYGVFLPHRTLLAMATLGVLFGAYVAIEILGEAPFEPIPFLMVAGICVTCVVMVRSTAISRREKFLQRLQLEELAAELDRNLQDLSLENRAVERAATENAMLADELALSRMAAEENSTLLELLLNTMVQGVICYGTDLKVIKCNHRYAEFMRIPDELTKPGTSIEDIFERSLAEGIFGTAEARDQALDMVRIHARSGDFEPVTLEHETAPGLFIEIHTMPFPGGGVVSTVTDISARKIAEHHIRHKALHDPLTGLANRELFKDRIEAAIARSKRIGHYAALAMIDLDKFKPVNDTYGHPAGDAVLKTIANLLRGLVREVDTVARLGGDEFAIVFDGLPTLKDVSIPIDRIFQRLQSPIRIQDFDIEVGISMGVAFFPIDAESADMLADMADRALYEAKASGRGRCILSRSGYEIDLTASATESSEYGIPDGEQQGDGAEETSGDATTQHIRKRV